MMLKFLMCAASMSSLAASPENKTARVLPQADVEGVQPNVRWKILGLQLKKRGILPPARLIMTG